MNKMKKFFTLDRHHAEGFTLVELIVVIAILAILGGVAVPAYSGYVARANRGVDETLAGEIEQALMLAYYDGVLKPGAAVVVYYGDAANENYNVVTDPDGDGDDHGAAAAMSAVFGDSFQSARLKWNGWKDELGIVANAEMMGYVQDSSYNGSGLGTMLGQVQYVVNAAGKYLENSTLENQQMLDYLAKTDVQLGEGNMITSDNVSAVANVAVFSVANTIGGYEGSNEEFYASMINGNVGGEDHVANQAARYALTLGMATYLDEQNGTTGKEGSYVSQLTLDDKTLEENPSAILDQMNAVMGKMQNDPGFSGYLGVGGEGVNTNAQGYKDAMAFLAYMQGVENASDTMLENYDISNSNFFGDGTMESYVQNYVDAGNILSAVNVREGAFVFIFDGINFIGVPVDY